MDLPEFGVVGEATVLAMEPCPAVPPGRGNLVTGIFEHTSGSVIELYLDGAAEPIGCTANHRFWSKDREDYVETGELRSGVVVGMGLVFSGWAALRSQGYHLHGNFHAIEGRRRSLPGS